MKTKIIVIITVSAIIVFALFYFLVFNNNKSTQDILSMLKLPITEDKILKKEIRTQPGFTTLILHVDHDIQFEEFSLIDIAPYEGSSVYDNLATMIKEHNMSIDEVEIRLYYVQYSKKDGLFSKTVFANPVYIIRGNGNRTLIYTNIPESVVLLHEYRME